MRAADPGPSDQEPTPGPGPVGDVVPADRPAAPDPDLIEMRTVVRRVVASRVRDPHLVEDLVQETLARVLAARDRVEEHTAIPYAITTARHLVASTWRRSDVDARNRHRTVDLAPVPRPDDTLVDREEDRAVAAAMGNLSPRDRDALVEHDVEGRDLASLATDLGTTPGALAAQLKRTRARLRVEYLLAMDRTEPPTPTCRPVLMALSGGDRRRQAELDVSGHLLACGFCAGLATGLGGRSGDDATTVVPVTRDADVVTARKAGREMALAAGFGATDGTVVATAISEVTRNIVKFAGTGEVRISRVEDGPRRGLLVVARDAGPGIPDVDQALADGHSTYGGLGLGLPGCRRLMDEFSLESEAGKGTTVTMRKWVGTDRSDRRGGAAPW